MPATRSYAISYYVDSETVYRYRVFGRIMRTTGYATGRERFGSFDEAEKMADHINRFGPKYPARVVECTSEPNSGKFIVGRWTQVAAA